MPLITLVIILIIVGVALWLVNAYIPMAPSPESGSAVDSMTLEQLGRERFAGPSLHLISRRVS